MSLYLERVLSKNFQENEFAHNATRLAGGIDKEIYKVPVIRDGKNEPVVVSIFRNPGDWWKVNQELMLREILENDRETGVPELLEAGFDYLDGQRYAFVVRDFIEGDSLDELLLSQFNQQSVEQDIGSLASDLGNKLAKLHSYKMSMFGMIGKPSETVDSNWGGYVFGKIDYYFRALSEAPQEKRVGAIRVKDIVNIEQQLYESLGTRQSSLYGHYSASLAHGDAHFRNFITNRDENGKLKIMGVIDTEEALGADPEIDVAFIENWLHFTPYRDIFQDHKDDFLSGYIRKTPSPDHYKDRRYIYHALRSISYLKALFTLDTAELLRTDPKHKEYIEKHFTILKSLSEGSSLEDLGIKSLL